MSDRHILTQTTHQSHLVAVNSVDDTTSTQEQSEKNTEETEPEQKTAAKETPKPAAPVQEETKQQGPAKTHKVVKGDNLYNISKKYYGEKKYWTVIRDANKGKLGRNDSVRIGQLIVIPELKDKKK